MSHQDAKAGQTLRLPARLRAVFWDYDWRSLTWENDRDLIIARVLACGDWEAVVWLRSHLGNRALRRWIEACQGRDWMPDGCGSGS
jgi:hypothetical protein